MRDFQAAIFDLDGTLVNSVADLANAMNHVLHTNNFPTHEVQAYNYFAGNGIRKLVERALPETARSAELIPHFHRQMLERYNAHCTDLTRPYDGIVELLDFLKKTDLKLCVLSNKIDCLAQKIVATLFAPNTFDWVQGALPNIPHKPDPTSALAIAQRLEIPTSKFLYLGDTNVDMATARNAGMTAVGCTWGFRPREELAQAGADLIIDHPKDLIKILNA